MSRPARLVASNCVRIRVLGSGLDRMECRVMVGLGSRARLVTQWRSTCILSRLSVTESRTLDSKTLTASLVQDNRSGSEQWLGYMVLVGVRDPRLVASLQAESYFLSLRV